MKLLSTITFFFLFSLTIQAQTIQVLDEETKNPVTGVAVFNESKLMETHSLDLITYELD